MSQETNSIVTLCNSSYDIGKKEGAIEELEKIKDEIQGLIDSEESCCGNTTFGYQCLSVINDKISELKSDNKHSKLAN